jgi:type I restriction enzyme S subunit
MIYPDKLIRARVPIGSVLPLYLEAYFSTSIPRSHIEKKAKSSAGQQGISGHDLRGVPVALAPLGEQRQILAKIDTLFAWGNRVADCVANARNRTVQVDQGVLGRAFRGEL